MLAFFKITKNKIINVKRIYLIHKTKWEIIESGQNCFGFQIIKSKKIDIDLEYILELAYEEGKRDNFINKIKTENKNGK